eukprot:2664850-Prymnesium_polylepis.1
MSRPRRWRPRGSWARSDRCSRAGAPCRARAASRASPEELAGTVVFVCDPAEVRGVRVGAAAIESRAAPVVVRRVVIKLRPRAVIGVGVAVAVRVPAARDGAHAVVLLGERAVVYRARVGAAGLRHAPHTALPPLKASQQTEGEPPP